MTLELSKEELIDLFFDLGKSIAAHKIQLEDYKQMRVPQGVNLEESRIANLTRIRSKIKERIEENG